MKTNVLRGVVVALSLLALFEKGAAAEVEALAADNWACGWSPRANRR